MPIFSPVPIQFLESSPTFLSTRLIRAERSLVVVLVGVVEMAALMAAPACAVRQAQQVRRPRKLQPSASSWQPLRGGSGGGGGATATGPQLAQLLRRDTAQGKRPEPVSADVATGCWRGGQRAREGQKNSARRTSPACDTLRGHTSRPQLRLLFLPKLVDPFAISPSSRDCSQAFLSACFSRLNEPVGETHSTTGHRRAASLTGQRNSSLRHSTSQRRFNGDH